MECPRCKITLKPQTINERSGEILVDICPSCHGIWFDKEELVPLQNISEPVFMEWRKIPNEHDQLEALFCPSCPDHAMMQKAEHPRDTKVIFDYCETCQGIWLDGGELEAIQKESWLSAFVNLIRKMHKGVGNK